MSVQRALLAALMLTGLNACVSWTGQATETEGAICQALGEALPTRSRQDTDQTEAEIQRLYADYISACPAYRHLIPNP
jgi:hypothetical protein